jgi:hypothetical protein
MGKLVWGLGSRTRHPYFYNTEILLGEIDIPFTFLYLAVADQRLPAQQITQFLPDGRDVFYTP